MSTKIFTGQLKVRGIHFHFIKMFSLVKITIIIVLFGTPVQLFPAMNIQNGAVGPKSSISTSPKAIPFPEQFFRHVYNKPVPGKTVKEIQYAPLNVDTKTTTSTSKTVAVTTTPPGKVYNEHLEPRTIDVKAQNSKCYNYNPIEHVDPLSPVSRSPGHNALYRGFPLIVPREKPFKVSRRVQDVVRKSVPMKKVLKKLNFIKPTSPSQTLHLPGASTAVPFLSKQRSIITNNEFIMNSDMSDKNIKLGPVKRPPTAPHNKLHRLHLNIARVYSPVSQKSSNYSGVYSINMDTEHARLQADLPPILHLSNQNKDKTVTIKG